MKEESLTHPLFIENQFLVIMFDFPVDPTSSRTHLSKYSFELMLHLIRLTFVKMIYVNRNTSRTLVIITSHVTHHWISKWEAVIICHQLQVNCT